MRILRCVEIFCSLLLAALPLASRAQDRPEPPQKKLIEFGWDEPDTSFLRTHIAAMEQTPFDGCVFHVMATTAPGTRTNFTWQCWGKRAFSEAELRPRSTS